MDAHTVVEAYWAAAEARDWDAFGRLLADDVVYEGPLRWRERRSKSVFTWSKVHGAPAMVAERAGAKIIEFPAASHAGGYTRYTTPFVKVVEEAAASLAG